MSPWVWVPLLIVGTAAFPFIWLGFWLWVFAWIVEQIEKEGR